MDLGAATLSGAVGAEESLLACGSARLAEGCDVLMLGARATEGPDGVELKKDQLRLVARCWVACLGDAMVLASVVLDTDSSDGILTGSGRLADVMRPLLWACLEPDAMGTSNMS